MTQPQVIAGATIQPARFIQMEPGGTSGEVISCVDDTFAIGVTTEATQDAPQSGSGTDAATVGEMVQYIGIGQEALLKADATGYASGKLVKAGAVGVGVLADTTDDIACAISLETTGANEFGRVLIISPFSVQA